MVDTFDEKGRVRTSTEYIGAWYYFQEDSKVVGAVIKKLPLYCAAGWLCYIAAMLFPSASMHRLYCVLPFAAAAVPLFLLTDCTFSLCRMDPARPMEHRRADLVNNRYPPIALMTAVFPAFALAGGLIGLITGGSVQKGDFIFVLCAAALVVIGRQLFSFRGEITAVRKQPEPDGPEQNGPGQCRPGTGA